MVQVGASPRGKYLGGPRDHFMGPMTHIQKKTQNKAYNLMNSLTHTQATAFPGKKQNKVSSPKPLLCSFPPEVTTAVTTTAISSPRPSVTPPPKRAHIPKHSSLASALSCVSLTFCIAHALLRLAFLRGVAFARLILSRRRATGCLPSRPCAITARRSLASLAWYATEGIRHSAAPPQSFPLL